MQVTLGGGIAMALMSFVLFGWSHLGLSALLGGFVVYGLAAIITGIGVQRSYPHPTLGLCNTVTMLRLAMVGCLVMALIAAVPPSWTLFIFAIATLSLDGLDGWLARRENLTSAFGARFDMETDALFALILAIMAFSAGTAGVYVLLLGLPSYLFFVAKFIWPWLDAPLPDLFSRKAVCVAQLLVLIVLQIPALPSQILAPATALVAAALVWSFGRDILWLWRAR